MQINVSQISQTNASGFQLNALDPKIGGELFSSILKEAAQSSIGSVKGAEKAAISGLLGNTSVTDVVHSVMAAERSFHTILAIRDKAVGAYQEISRLQI